MADWDFVVAKFAKRCASLLGSSMSSGGRLILLDSSLSSIVYYYMSMFFLPKTVIDKLDKHRRRFFCQGGGVMRRYYLVKWSRVCRSNSNGGLGVKDTRKQNTSLLVKWWWKLETQKGVWQDIIRAKYLRRQTMTSFESKFNDSPICKAIVKVKEHYLAGRKVVLQSGNLTRVWKDPLLGSLSFVNRSPCCLVFSISLMQLFVAGETVSLMCFVG